MIIGQYKHICGAQFVYLISFYALSRGHEIPKLAIFRRINQINLKNVSFSNHIFINKLYLKKINIFPLKKLHIWAFLCLVPGTWNAQIYYFPENVSNQFEKCVIFKSHIHKSMILWQYKHIFHAQLVYLDPFYALSRGHEMLKLTIFWRINKRQLNNVSFSNHIFRNKW